jgi:vancomycin permeability regulator SanA
MTSFNFKWRWFLYLIIVLIWAIWFLNLTVSSGSRFIAIDCQKNVSHYPVALVLGTRILNAATSSQAYLDRLQTAVELYNNKKVDKILVSGDNGQVTYDEVSAGKDYLLKAGIPAGAIFLDHAGANSYDSLYRAKYVFTINRLLIITQNYELPRVLYVSNKLGLSALGCSADKRVYPETSSWRFQEIFSQVQAWFDINFFTRSKYLGEKEDINGDGQQTWDQLNF